MSKTKDKKIEVVKEKAQPKTKKKTYKVSADTYNLLVDALDLVVDHKKPKKQGKKQPKHKATKKPKGKGKINIALTDEMLADPSIAWTLDLALNRKDVG